jgi:hypothetical protein
MWDLVDAGRHEVHRHGKRMLHLPTSGGNPVIAAALTVVAAAEDATSGGVPVGAWAGRADDDNWAFCQWQSPHLYTPGPLMEWLRTAAGWQGAPACRRASEPKGRRGCSDPTAHRTLGHPFAQSGRSRA